MSRKYTEVNDKSVYWIIGGFSLVALVFIIFVAFRESKQVQGITQIASYKKADTSQPKVIVPFHFQDFGKMSVNDIKTAEFNLENQGDKPLQLFKVTSSCDCTFGTITINGQTSPQFSMHSKSNWTGTLAPSGKATVAVTYKPSIMPVKGEVTRVVYVSTNDPDNKELTFTVKANVE